VGRLPSPQHDRSAAGCKRMTGKKKWRQVAGRELLFPRPLHSRYDFAPQCTTPDGPAMRWLLIGYMFLFIDRPFEVWPWLGDIHIERFYMLFSTIAWTVYPAKRGLSNPQHAAYAGFALAVVTCWVMSPFAEKGQPIV